MGNGVPPISHPELSSLLEVSARCHAQALDHDGRAGCHSHGHEDLLLTRRLFLPPWALLVAWSAASISGRQCLERC